MAHIKDDCDQSIARDSVFDWGTSRRASEESEDVAAAGANNNKGKGNGGDSPSEPSSRYDPKAMSRIVDITDLVDDSDTGSDDESEFGFSPQRSNSGRNIAAKSLKNARHRSGGTTLLPRRAAIVAALVAIIGAASVAIGIAVMSADRQASSSGGGMPLAPDARATGLADEAQHLLETAERIIYACSESNLHDGGIAQCHELCVGNMCCFRDGEDSCRDDEEKNCSVYTGCEALV